MAAWQKAQATLPQGPTESMEGGSGTRVKNRTETYLLKKSQGLGAPLRGAEEETEPPGGPVVSTRPREDRRGDSGQRGPRGWGGEPTAQPPIVPGSPCPGD